MPDFDISSYVKRRDSIVMLLNQTANIAKQLNQLETSKTIEDSIQQLMDDKFNVVVVGEFSRGKSTVINALLGSLVLPSSIKPTTTILNKISYSESTRIRLVYREKASSKQRIEEITHEHFKKIIAPVEPVKGDKESFSKYETEMKNFGLIEYAEVGFNSSFCKDGVEIVDTPGTNDLDPRREEIANSFIPKSDAAILVLSANQPLAQSEAGFLKERLLTASIQKIFFVINFKDRLKNQDEESKVLTHIKKNLSEIISDPRLFLVSAKGALNYRRQQAGEILKTPPPSLESTGYIEFESQLSKFLAEERGDIKLLKPVERCLNIISELDRGIQMISQSLSVSLEKYQEQARKIRGDLSKLSTTIDNASDGLKTGLNLAGDEIKHELKKRLNFIAQTAVGSLNTYQGELTKEDIARAVESTVAPMQTELSGWLNRRENEAILSKYSRANQRFAFEMEAIDNQVSQSLSLQVYNNSNLVTINTYDSEVTTPTIASTVGAFFLAGILTGGGAIFIAPIVGFFLHANFEAQYRERELGKVRNQIDARYHDSIPDMLRSWEKQWNKKADSLIDAFNSEAQRRKKAVETQLDSINSILKLEKSNMEKTKQQLSEQQIHLDKIRRSLLTYKQELNH